MRINFLVEKNMQRKNKQTDNNNNKLYIRYLHTYQHTLKFIKSYKKWGKNKTSATILVIKTAMCA